MTTVFGEIIHTFPLTHTHRLHTGVTPARHCCEVPSYFSAALYMEGVDRGEHTIS